MGTLARNDFSLGWFPSADAINAPKNALLRMDNLTLDEQGAVSLRQGSAKVNSSAFSDIDVHSLFATQMRIATPFDYTQSFEADYFTSVAGIAQFTSSFERSYQSGTDGPKNHTQFFESDNNFAINPTLGSLSKYRFAGAEDHVYVNGSATSATIDGVVTDDIAFGSHMGQVLYARSSTKKKYDGRTERNWGIGKPAGKPTLEAIPGPGRALAPIFDDGTKWSAASPFDYTSEFETTYFSSIAGIAQFTSAEFERDYAGTVIYEPIGANNYNYAWEADLGFVTNDATGEGSVAPALGAAGIETAIKITPNPGTGRGTATRVFDAAEDFNLLVSAGKHYSGTDDDIFTFDAYLEDPKHIVSITLAIDFNDGTFQDDYAYYTFVNGEPFKVILSNDEYLVSNYSAEGTNRDDLLSRLIERDPQVTRFRNDKPVGNTGWTKFSVPRGKFQRVGGTSGKGWNTAKAVRFTVEAVDSVSTSVKVDVDGSLFMFGGTGFTLMGKYKAVVVGVRNNGTYEAVSAPSEPSAEIDLEVSGLRVTLGTDTINSLDSQVNELRLFLYGGRLNGYYQYAIKGGGPFTGAQVIDVVISDRDALIQDIRLETDNTQPPDDIIGIEGPHFDRTLCLTATHLYPSRQRNPDSFAQGEAIRVGDSTETALWVKKDNEVLYVGTTKDIYRIDGDWTVRDDGSLNVAKRPLGVTAPPVSSAVTVGRVEGAGDIVVYLASDGWRVLGGPLLTTSAIDLLWRGQTRHGVSPVNISGSTARFRCALSKNMLLAITPEGASTTSSTVIHAYHFGRQRWYRWTYTPSWRSIYTEPDGILVAGDTSGFVYTMDEATKQDAGSDIPVVVWTPADDNGEMLNHKDIENLTFIADTGSATATVNIHLDGSSTSSSTETFAQDGTAFGVSDISGLSQCRQIQLRITGSFSTFILRAFTVNYLDNPIPKVYHDTGFVDLDGSAIRWVRRLRIKARSPGTLTVTPYWDGTAGTARSVTVTANKQQVYTVPLGRDDKGKTVRVVITSSSPSQVYWVEWEFSGSGKQNQKKHVTLGEAA